MPEGILGIVSIYLLGLGLNLTPCVYPMLSITVSLFGNQSESKNHFWKALVYVLGMATMYSALGVIAALTGGLFGSVLQNTYVLIGIAVLLILLALSMFGFYQLNAPPALLAKIGGQKRAGMFGFYLSGLLVGIVAAPCVGPPIIALLAVVGSQGDPVYGFFAFFIMSLGLGTPYLILGTYSGLIKKVPKSGVWLIWVERLFGTILLVVAAYYLLVAFKPDLISWLPTAALVGSGVYLGFIEKSGNKNISFNRFKKTAGLIAIVVGLTLPFTGPRQNVVWETYSAEKLEAAKVAEQPVIFDFYADWCIPCHELDRFTYSDPKVIAALDHFLRIKVDLTDTESPEAKELTDKYKIVGVPTIVFLDKQGNEVKEARANGFIDADEMLEILQSPRFDKAAKT